jgi:hypothetical protein
MMSKVFVLGNGESRQPLNLDVLKTIGKVYGCNALYRDFTPDGLICVDSGMMQEVYDSGYALENRCYFRNWGKLPGEMYDMVVQPESFFAGWGEGFFHETERKGYTQFVLQGTEPDKIMMLYNMIKKQKEELGHPFDAEDIRAKLGKHGCWVTWVADEDQITEFHEDIAGWSAGPIAVNIAITENNPTDVFLVGFDLNSPTDKVNNVYKSTQNYIDGDYNEVPSVNWVKQHKQNFTKFPDTTFWKVNPKPLTEGDKINARIEEWDEFENVKYIDFKEFEKILDISSALLYK